MRVQGRRIRPRDRGADRGTERLLRRHVRMTRAAALLPALSLAACLQVGGAPSSTGVAGAGEVPFTLGGSGGSAILVPVRLNGTGPYQFVLDTGATFTCVDEQLAERLELPQPVGLVGYGATLGQSGAVTLHKIKTLEVGPAKASELTACALDLAGVNKLGLGAEGLLGLNFLRSFNVNIDFERKVITLSQP